MDDNEGKGAAFKELTNTTTLSDVRRTRTRSTGRPPSQGFMKEVRKSLISVDSNDDDDDGDADEESSDQMSTPNGPLSPVIKTPTDKTATSPRQIQYKFPESENSVVDGTTRKIVKSSALTMELNQVLPLKKKTVPLPVPASNAVVKEEAQWLQELKKRRKHKTSLRDTFKYSEENESLVHVEKTESFSTVISNGGDAISKVYTSIQAKEYRSTTDNNVESVINSKEKYKKINADCKTEISQENNDKTNKFKSDKVPIETSLELSEEKIPTIDKVDAVPEAVCASQPNVEQEKNLSTDAKNESIEERDLRKRRVQSESSIDFKQIQNSVEDLKGIVKQFEENCNKQMKKMRNELKTIQIEVKNQCENLTSFLNTVQRNVASREVQD